MTAAKSIVDVQVNDEEFKKFVALFNDYRAKIEELPDEWKHVGDAIGEASDSAQKLAHASSTAPKAVAGSKAGVAAVVALFVEATAALMEQAHLLRQQEETESRIARQAEKDGRQRNDAAKKLYETQEKVRKSSEKTSSTWKGMAGSVGAAAGSVLGTVGGVVGGAVSIAGDVLRWVGMGAVGLLGAGGAGLFGAEKLAHTSDDMRRTAQGLGTTPGNEHALDVNFGRVIGDTGSYLSNIQAIASDQTNSWGIASDIHRLKSQGLDTAEIGAALVPILKQRFIQGGKTTTGMQVEQLGAVADLQTLNAIATQPDSDLQEWNKSFHKDKSTLAIGDDRLKNWQDLHRDLERSGLRVEKALIDDFAPLAPQIGILSTKVTDLAVEFGDHLEPKIKDFADWLGSGAVKQAEDDFVGGLHRMATALGIEDDTPARGDKSTSSDDGESSVSRWVNRTRDAVTKHVFGLDPEKVNRHLYGSSGDIHALGATAAPGRPEDWRALHNPGDLFVPGGNGQMLGFPSDEEGLRGIDKQLLIYQDRDKLDTLEGIAKKYAPPGQNDTEAYIKGLASRTGFSRDQHLDFHDTDVASKVIVGITKQEHNNTSFDPRSVRIVIENNTGGSAVVSTSQLAS